MEISNMHNKPGVSFISVFLGLLFLYGPMVKAQSVFNNFNAPANVQVAPGSGQMNQVMSPSDFQNNVTKLGQQNLNNLSQQVNQQIAKSAPLSNNKNMPAPPQPVNNSFNASPPPSTAISPPAETPAKNDVYTGFNFQDPNAGSPGSTTGGTTNNSNSGGGWNIKY
jgi:hypothetical protein